MFWENNFTAHKMVFKIPQLQLLPHLHCQALKNIFILFFSLFCKHFWEARNCCLYFFDIIIYHAFNLHHVFFPICWNFSLKMPFFLSLYPNAFSTQLRELEFIHTYDSEVFSMSFFYPYKNDETSVGLL